MSKPEINFSNISRELIRKTKASLRNELSYEKDGSLKEVSDIGKDYETGSNKTEDIQQTSELKDKTTETKASKLESEDGQVLTHKEISDIRALIFLAENLQDSTPLNFLVASDYLAGEKDSLLSKNTENVVAKYINRIFEVRENFLGAENADSKLADLYPLIYANLTKNKELIQNTFEGRTSEELILELEKTFSPQNQTDKGSQSVLDLLMQVNDFDFTTFFIEKLSQKPELFEFLKEFLNNKDSEDKNALGLAASCGYAKTVKALLESPILTQDQEFFEEFLNNKDSEDKNALGLAASCGYAKTVKALLESSILTQDQEFFKEFLNNKDFYGRNALDSAVFNGHTEIVKELLESAITQDQEFFKELLNNKNTSGHNALYSAIFHDHTEIVKTFLEISINYNQEFLKEFLNNKDYNGKNALGFAAFHGCTETVKAILESPITQNQEFFKEFLNSKDLDGRNALGLASYCNKTGIEKLLLEKGSIINNPDNKISDTCRKSLETAETITDYIKTIPKDLSKFLRILDQDNLKQSINISVKKTTLNNKHLTPLQFAASLGEVESMRVLIEAGADINVVNNEYKTALHCAYEKNKVEAINYLIETGANTEITDINGQRACDLVSPLTSVKVDRVRLVAREGDCCVIS